MASLTVTQGKVFKENLPVLNPAGTAYDLTGCTLWFTVKLRSNQAAADATDTLGLIKLYLIVGGAGSGITVPTPTNGMATIKMSTAQTAALTVGQSYVWDLQVKDTSNDVFTADTDALYVKYPVTKRVTTP